MKFGTIRAGAVLLASLGLAGLATAGGQDKDAKKEKAATQQRAETEQAQVLDVKREDVDRVLQTWEGTPKDAATAMLEKYGTPDGLTDEMMVWHDTGDFERTIVYKEPVEHHFPMKHEDVLEQTVKLEVPPDKLDELAAYDGSVIVDRTAARISARCDKEVANYLALNLAHQIIEGEKSVEEARLEYARTIAKVMEGETPEITQRLMFETGAEDLNVPDESIMDRVTARRN